MTDNNQKPTGQKFELGEDIITNLDLSRTIRELEKLNDMLHQEKLRGSRSSEAPAKTTEILKNVAETNKLSLRNSEERGQLLEGLQKIKTAGKKIHISFAVEPSPAVLQKITAWMRQNIEDQLVLEVGVQPTISVGCVVRTTNKVFDMSLKSRFADSKKLIATSLEKHQ